MPLPRVSKDDAFAWSDPDVAGSRLDPQTADFARRAAELWTQVVQLRELSAVSAGGQAQDAAAVVGHNHTGSFASVVEQVIQWNLLYPFGNKYLRDRGSNRWLTAPRQ